RRNCRKCHRTVAGRDRASDTLMSISTSKHSLSMRWRGGRGVRPKHACNFSLAPPLYAMERGKQGDVGQIGSWLAAPDFSIRPRGLGCRRAVSFQLRAYDLELCTSRGVGRWSLALL